MIRIDCPWCGPRDEIEFTYRGDATVHAAGRRDAPAEAFYDYVYARRTRAAGTRNGGITRTAAGSICRWSGTR